MIEKDSDKILIELLQYAVFVVLNESVLVCMNNAMTMF